MIDIIIWSWQAICNWNLIQRIPLCRLHDLIQCCQHYLYHLLDQIFMHVWTRNFANFSDIIYEWLKNMEQEQEKYGMVSHMNYGRGSQMDLKPLQGRASPWLGWQWIAWWTGAGAGQRKEQQKARLRLELKEQEQEESFDESYQKGWGVGQSVLSIPVYLKSIKLSIFNVQLQVSSISEALLSL